MRVAGDLEFDPVHGTLTGPDGKAVTLHPPEGEELPPRGSRKGEEGFEAPAAENGERLHVVIPPGQRTAQLLQPFPRWDGKDFERLPILRQDQGQDHDGSHFAGRPVAQVPGPSGQDQRQHVPGSAPRLLSEPGRATTC